MNKKLNPGLSVVIAVHNEEQNLPTFLAAIKPIADEVVVIDGQSSDATAKLAREFGAKVFTVRNLKNFHINKEIGIQKATYEWILLMDADEIVTQELGKEIRDVVDGTRKELDLSRFHLFVRHMNNIAHRDGVTYSQTPPINGYFIARKNYFLGSYLMHSGVYPDGVIRLFRNGYGSQPAKTVHEQVSINGGVSWLKEPMIHMSDPIFARYVWRANRYTSLTAQELVKQKVGTSLGTIITYMFIKPVVVTFLIFLRYKGFMDGLPGFVWALMSGLHYPMAYMKYVELEMKKK